MDTEEGEDSYLDRAKINEGLENLGMLSTITQSRKDYIKESEDFLGKLKLMTMNSDEAGPSGSNKECVVFSLKKRASETSLSPDALRLGVINAAQKENHHMLEGFRVLTMNSHFITGFKAGYQLPWNGLRENIEKRASRCALLRRRRIRSHPYERAIKEFLSPPRLNNREMYKNAFDSDQSQYRLRTASLSSGTSNNRKLAVEFHQKETILPVLKRSKSMENLSDCIENSLIVSPSKCKDLDSVSNGIQQLKMEDCT